MGLTLVTVVIRSPTLVVGFVHVFRVSILVYNTKLEGTIIVLPNLSDFSMKPLSPEIFVDLSTDGMCKELTLNRLLIGPVSDFGDITAIKLYAIGGVASVPGRHRRDCATDELRFVLWMLLLFERGRTRKRETKWLTWRMAEDDDDNNNNNFNGGRTVLTLAPRTTGLSGTARAREADAMGFCLVPLLSLLPLLPWSAFPAKNDVKVF